MTLAEYLELALRNGGGIIMMQQYDDDFGMYVGNAAEGQADVTFDGTVAATIATGILRLTRVGREPY